MASNADSSFQLSQFFGILPHLFQRVAPFDGLAFSDGSFHVSHGCLHMPICTLNRSQKSSVGVKREFVRIANFEVCKCAQEGLPAKHCSIDVSIVDLHSTKAVAISYTYGEFNRRFVPVGHSRKHPTDRITLELGEEWNTEQLLTRFVELSKEHCGIWLDQISFTKDAMLSKIPIIYQTLPVIALLPGSHCECLPEAVKKFEKGDIEAVKKFEKGEGYRFETLQHEKDLDLQSYSMKCFNFLGTSSYFDRVWTRQEAVYATKLSVLWCSPHPAPCVSGLKLLAENADLREGRSKNADLVALLTEGSPELVDGLALRAAAAEGSLKLFNDLVPLLKLSSQAKLTEVLSKIYNPNLAFGTEESRKLVHDLVPFLRLSYEAKLIEVLSEIDNLQIDPHCSSVYMQVMRKLVYPCVSACDHVRMLVGNNITSLQRFLFERGQCYSLGRLVENISREGSLRERFYDNNPSSFNKQIDIAYFLLGREFRSTPLNMAAFRRYGTPLTKLFFQSFIRRLGELGRTQRRATQKCDYIAAVWPDCPHFSLPPHYRELQAEVLLETVLRDSENELGFWVVSNLPAGLFGKSNTFRWCPRLHIREANIKSSKDLYHLFMSNFQVRTLMPGGYYAFHMQSSILKSSIPQSRLKLAKNYRTEMSHLSTNQALQAMRNVWKNGKLLEGGHLWSEEIGPDDENEHEIWAFHLAKFLLRDLKEGNTLKEFPDPNIGRYAFLLMMADGEFCEGEWRLPEIDHCDVVCRLVSRLFSLDYLFLQEEKLQVMIILHDKASYIGLTCLRDISFANVSTISIKVADWEHNVKVTDRESLRTLDEEFPPHEREFPSLVYEVTRATDDQQSESDEKIAPEHKAFPRYSVIGVWLSSVMRDNELMGNNEFMDDNELLGDNDCMGCHDCMTNDDILIRHSRPKFPDNAILI